MTDKTTPDEVTQIAGRTLDEWQEFARRDDCLERMVPSDLRQLVSAARHRIAAQSKADDLLTGAYAFELDEDDPKGITLHFRTEDHRNKALAHIDAHLQGSEPNDK